MPPVRRKRLSICYAAPGHALVSTSGSARNILSAAAAMSKFADLTVAFRDVREPVRSTNVRVLTIEERKGDFSETKDDVAARGLSVAGHLSYLRTLAEFAKQLTGSCDLVLEKGWRLSGVLADACRRRGMPAAVVENDVRHWSESIHSARTLARYGAHRAAQFLAGYCSRRVPLIIAETDELKATLVTERGIAPERIEVAGLGVDHELFRPLDQTACRKRLGIAPGAMVLLYVGGMDLYHDVGPVLDALGQRAIPGLEFHLVGDGECRRSYEEKARRAAVPVRFHGQVSHEKVPEYIAAADLCLAPYRVSAFPNQTVSFSTLKIPEYMACGRPVVSVPSGHIKKLVGDQCSGFLFSNDPRSWIAFLGDLPTAEKLREMGVAAEHAAADITWESTARRYLELCQRLVPHHSIGSELGCGR
jgi:glycosyltransferase involved in cell wall biosynthesis